MFDRILVTDYVFCVVALLICVINNLYIRRLISAQRLFNKNTQRKQNATTLAKRLRAYQVEHGIVVIQTVICLLIMIVSRLFALASWIKLAVFVMPTIMFGVICVTRIIYADSTSREKTRREEVIEAAFFVVFMVIGVVILCEGILH